MGIAVGGSKSGTFVEINVVPLIDVLLVLLVILMIIPHSQKGLQAELPQPAPPEDVRIQPEVIVVQVLADGSLRINEERVKWEAFEQRLEQILKTRESRVAFVRGDSGIEFQVVAQVIDIMVAAGVTSVGLMTPRFQKSADCICPKKADVNSKQGWISMNEALPKITRRVAAIAALLILVGGVSGCNKLKARDLLNKGVNAFKNGQSDAAIEDFKQAKASDPELLNARLYLATAYASLYIPGAPSKENQAKGEQAVQEFKEVLDKDPNNISAIDGTGSILFQMAGQPFDPKKFEESKTFHQRHIQLKPDDPEPYYWIGVIDWTLAFRANGEMRMDYNKNNIKKQVRDDAPLPPSVRAEYVNKYGALVDEGIGDLQKAILLRPEYDDAMAYLNLLYRRKADMVGTVDERNALLKQADDLVDKVKEIKQKRAELPQQTS